MSINSVLTNFPVEQLGASSGLYLRFSETSKKWSVVQLNCFQQMIRFIGLGYQSTRLAVVANQLSASEEKEIDIELLKKIHTAWLKNFPKIESPLKIKITPFSRLDESNPSLVRNIAPEEFKIGETTISIAGGKLSETTVECILFPTIKLPNYVYSHMMEEEFADMSRAMGRDFEADLKILWAHSPTDVHPFPPITVVGKFAAKGVKLILLPKKLPPLTLDEKAYVPEDELEFQGIDFFRCCLHLAKMEGVRRFAFSPHSLARGEVEKWMKNDLMVIEGFIKEYPGVFEEIQFIYKFNTEHSAHQLAQAISTSRVMRNSMG